MLALIGLLIFLRSKSAAKKVEPGAETAAIERRDLEQSLTLSGTVESGAAYSVTSKLTDVEVKQVNVKVGDSVKAGQTIIILEAMKLENEIKAPRDGVVSSIAVSKGQAVNNKAVLLTLE